MPLKAVLFDLDGTLLDTAPDFITCLNRLLDEQGRAPLPAELIRNTVSNGANALIQLGFEDSRSNESLRDSLRERLLEIYSECLSEESRPFEGITDLLQFIHKQQLQWGIVTNKPVIFTTPLLSQMNFPVPPSSVVCPDHVSQRKPDPEPLHLACKQISCQSSEAIYLGDHLRDIEAGKNANMPTVACTYGYISEGDDPQNWMADHIIHHPLEAIPLLQAMIH